jgi:hypothetical protein
LDLAQEHVGDGDLNIEEASKITLGLVREDFLKTELRGGECVGNELAGHTRISRSRSDLGRIVVECLGLTEIDFEILAGANIGNVDRHYRCADKQIGLVAAAFVDGLGDVAAQGLTDYRAFAIERVRVDPFVQAGLAMSYGLSTYEAAYLWLAAEMKVALVTFDARLARAARRHLVGSA